LTDAVGKVLADPIAASRIAARSDRVIRRDYTWRVVARRTAEIYSRAGTRSVD
jgi:glycosyltransferase involved in cell wall biosynthesis